MLKKDCLKNRTIHHNPKSFYGETFPKKALKTIAFLKKDNAQTLLSLPIQWFVLEAI